MDKNYKPRNPIFRRKDVEKMLISEARNIDINDLRQFLGDTEFRYLKSITTGKEYNW